MFSNFVTLLKNKSVLSVILSAFFILTMSGCKFSGDVVAEFKDGKITRGEVYDYLKARGISKDLIIKKKIFQENIIRGMALDVLTAREAEKRGFEASADFQYKLADAKRGFYASYIQRHFAQNGKFSEDAVALRLVKFTIRNSRMINGVKSDFTAKESDNECKLKRDSAINAIREYESGIKFEELAKKYSDDYSKKNGGLVENITRDMREPEFSDVVFKMNKGEYTKEPIKAGNAYYVVYLEDKIILTDKNIDSIISDEKRAAAMRKHFAARGINSHIEQLKQAPDVFVNYNLIEKGNPAAIVFKIGDKSITVKEIDAYAARGDNNSTMGEQKNIDSKSRRSIAEKLFVEELLARELAGENPEKNESFLKEWSYFYKSFLSNEYKNAIIAGQVRVSDGEIKEEYEKNKRASDAQSVIDVKQNIQQTLLAKKKKQAILAWEEKLLSDNSFRINENELDGE